MSGMATVVFLLMRELKLSESEVLAMPTERTQTYCDLIANYYKGG